ncbi:hypothetical protein QL285_070358 [Trifolium repens]|nr:hypothetical protein QL285_070358 [Trifolium repens]
MQSSACCSSSSELASNYFNVSLNLSNFVASVSFVCDGSSSSVCTSSSPFGVSSVSSTSLSASKSSLLLLLAFGLIRIVTDTVDSPSCAS